MRYNVHSPCAFHSRIAKTLGVLVGAALVATLGLPSAAQAQTPAAPTVTGTGDGTGQAAPPRHHYRNVGGGAWLNLTDWKVRQNSRSVAGRIYRAWRTMGRRDGGVRHGPR